MWRSGLADVAPLCRGGAAPYAMGLDFAGPAALVDHGARRTDLAGVGVGVASSAPERRSWRVEQLRTHPPTGRQLVPGRPADRQPWQRDRPGGLDGEHPQLDLLAVVVGAQSVGAGQLGAVRSMADHRPTDQLDDLGLGLVVVVPEGHGTDRRAGLCSAVDYLGGDLGAVYGSPIRTVNGRRAGARVCGWSWSPSAHRTDHRGSKRADRAAWPPSHAPRRAWAPCRPAPGQPSRCAPGVAWDQLPPRAHLPGPVREGCRRPVSTRRPCRRCPGPVPGSCHLVGATPSGPGTSRR